jgi:ABC-2 type transport system ATP-binding protein
VTPKSSAAEFAPVEVAGMRMSAMISVRDLVHHYQGSNRPPRNLLRCSARRTFRPARPQRQRQTLFRILSTLMVPGAGAAKIAGLDVVREPAALRGRIGVVFQAQSVDAKLTAYENLWHQGHLYGLRGPALKRRIEEILARVGLLDRAGDQVETFSGGMQRRIELAKGLLHRPEVLLLDEPTTGLDPGARRDLWQYLQILRDQERVSVIVTTHLMEEAERCDRLAILNEGKLVALGTPAELTREIGGDVVAAGGSRPRKTVDQIRRFISMRALGQHVRLEIEAGHRFVTDVVEAFRRDSGTECE